MDIVISFFIALLMGMGIGGAGFLVIYLTMVRGYGQIVAQGTNLLFFAIAALFAIVIHLFKRKIKISEVLLISVFGSLGAFLTSHLANIVDPKIPKTVLGILLVFSGSSTIFNIIKKKVNKK